MTNATHTPGPWIFDERYFNVIDEEGRTIAARPSYSSASCDVEEADMRLIAAAPELLAALSAVTACLRGFSGHEDFGPLDDEAVNAALVAIAKAKGE